MDAANLTDLDLEAQLLGAAMRSARVARGFIDLAADDFVDPIHAAIWTVVQTMAKADKPASPVAIVAEIGDAIEQLGGKDYLSALYLNGDRLGPSALQASERLRQLSLWRKLSRLGPLTAELMNKNLSAEDAASRIIGYVQGALSSNLTGLRTKRDVAKSAIEMALNPEDSTPTLIYGLDLLCHGGLRSTRLYGIGGLFGRGKTILAGTISENINAQKKPHLFFSLETQPEDIETRNIARAMDINASAIFDVDAPNHKRFRANANAYVDQMLDHTIFVHKPGATIDDIERSVIQCIHKYQIKGFILDYWQLIRGKEKGQSEAEHLRLCADRLAALCRRENIWGLLTAQVDENGNLATCPDGLKRACSLYITLRRDPNGSEAQFVTEKSNYTRLANIGAGDDGAAVVFDMAGPHFRSVGDE